MIWHRSISNMKMWESWLKERGIYKLYLVWRDSDYVRKNSYIQTLQRYQILCIFSLFLNFAQNPGLHYHKIIFIKKSVIMWSHWNLLEISHSSAKHSFNIFQFLDKTSLPAGNYMFQVNNRKTGARYEICSKLTIKTWT